MKPFLLFFAVALWWMPVIPVSAQVTNGDVDAAVAAVFSGTGLPGNTDPTPTATLSRALWAFNKGVAKAAPFISTGSIVETVHVTNYAATATIAQKSGEMYGGVLTNTGASGAIVLTLPVPKLGMHFRVYLVVGQDIDLNPADGTQILALTNATGDAISSAATIGNAIELVCLKEGAAGTWGAFAVSGTWTDSN